jgi:hypothetical protein
MIEEMSMTQHLSSCKSFTQHNTLRQFSRTIESVHQENGIELDQMVGLEIDDDDDDGETESLSGTDEDMQVMIVKESNTKKLSPADMKIMVCDGEKLYYQYYIYY